MLYPCQKLFSFFSTPGVCHLKGSDQIIQEPLYLVVIFIEGQPGDGQPKTSHRGRHQGRFPKTGRSDHHSKRDPEPKRNLLLQARTPHQARSNERQAYFGMEDLVRLLHSAISSGHNEPRIYLHRNHISNSFEFHVSFVIKSDSPPSCHLYTLPSSPASKCSNWLYCSICRSAAKFVSAFPYRHVRMPAILPA